MTCLTWSGLQSIGRHTTSSTSTTGARFFREEDCSTIAIQSDLSSRDVPVDVALVGAIVAIGDPIYSSRGNHSIAGIDYKT